MLESGTGASSLQARLSSVLDSISHFADTYADWTSCAPGYAQGPAFRLHAHTQAAQEHGSLETGGTAAGNYAGQASQAPALPILGEVWDEHVAFARVHAEGVAGLRALRQTVKREADFLEKYAEEVGDVHAVPISSNAPFLCALWSEVLHNALVHGPIIEIGAAVPLPPSFSSVSPSGEPMAGVGRPLKTGTRGRKNGKQALRNTKVDVVADAGRRWVRVLTTKPATLLAEFREAESYLTDSDSESSFSDQDISAKGAGRRGASHALTGPSDPAVRNCSLLRTARELRAAALFRSRSNTAGQRSSNGAVSADPAFDLDEAYGDGQTKLDVQIEIVLTRLALPAPRSGSVSGSGSHSADCAEDKNAPENYFSQDEQSRYERRLSIIADELARLGCHVVTGTRTFAASAQRTSLPASNGSVTSAMRPLPYPPQLRIPSLAAAKKGADDGDGDAAAEGEDGGEAAAPLIFPTLPKPLPPPTLRPSDCLNLDLSALVALASDITHGPLPPCSGLAYPNTDSNANSNSNCKVEDPLPDATVLEALFRQSASWKAAGAGGAGAGSSDNLPGSAAGSEAASEELSISTESHPRKLNLSKASAGRRTEEIPPPASSSSGKGTKQHGRALADQLFREMDPAKAFLQVVVDGVLGCVPELELEGEGSEREGTTAGKVRLYTTEEARDKFGDIMQLVAGATEKRRARALFGIRDGESFRSSLSESRAEAGSTNANASVNEHLETNANAKASGKTAGEDTDCVDAFWIGSRWAGSDARSVRIRRALVLPVQVLPSSYSLATSAPLPPSSHPPPSTSTRTFTPQMITALQLSLSDLRGAPRAIPISEDTSRPPLPSSFHRSQPTTGAGTAARQTPHTLRSLLRGAQEGMTTLTTNIASVKWLIKEIGRQASSSTTAPTSTSTSTTTITSTSTSDKNDSTADPASVNGSAIALPSAHQHQHQHGPEHEQQREQAHEHEHAVLWVMHPRSLAEKMRV